MKHCLILTLVLLTMHLTVVAQSDSWTTYQDAKQKLLFDAPGRVTINKNESMMILHAFENGAYILVRHDKLKNAQKAVKEFKFSDLPKGSEKQRIVKAGYTAWRVAVRYPRYTTTIFYIGCGDEYYVAEVEAASGNPSADRFIASFRIAGESFVDRPSVPVADAKLAVTFDKLDVTADVKNALAVKDQKDGPIEFADLDDDLPLDLSLYSRPLMMIRNPRPKMTNDAANRLMNGIVRANIEFLSTGEIGKIVIDNWSGPWQTKEIIASIRKAKFIPAEIDHKPVTVTKTLQFILDN